MDLINVNVQEIDVNEAWIKRDIYIYLVIYIYISLVTYESIDRKHFPLAKIIMHTHTHYLLAALRMSIVDH